MAFGSPAVLVRPALGLARPRRLLAGGRGVLLLAFGFAALSTVLRFALTDNLYPDDAELTAFARDGLRGGYSDQPPLYTWMLWAVFRVTGPGLAGLAVVRAAMLVALVGLTYRAARELVPDRRLHGPLAFSSVLLPAYGWHAATYLTHSLLLGVAVVGTVYAVARVVRRGWALDYVLLGVAVAVGALAKYNFALAAAGAVAAGLTVPAVRPRLLDRRILLAAAVALLILSPHLAWLGEWGGEVLRQVRNKADRAESPPYWEGVGQGLWAAVVCLGSCVAVVVPVLGWVGRGACRAGPTDPPVAWLGRFLLGLFVIHVALVFAAGVTRFHDRWVQPLLLPLPLWYLARFAPGTVTPGGVRVLNWATGLLAAAILGGQVAQVALADHLPGRFDPRLDYARLARDLDAAGFGRATILSWDREITGNLCPYLPDAGLRYLAGVEEVGSPAGPVAVLWDARHGPTLSLVLSPELESRYGGLRFRPARLRSFTLHARDDPDRSVPVLVYSFPRAP